MRDEHDLMTKASAREETLEHCKRLTAYKQAGLDAMAGIRNFFYV